MKLKKLSIRSKIPFYVLIMCMFCFGLLGIISYWQVSRLMTEQCKDNAMSMAVVAASEIDGDKFAQISSESDEYFNDVHDRLTKYKTCDLITYIYTMRLDDDKLFFVVDTDTEAPAGFGEEYPLIDSMKPAFKGVPCSDNVITSDQWGSYYSSYAPIFTQNGTVAGIVGCDIKLTELNSKLDQLRLLLIFLVTFFAVVCFVIYNRFSASMVSKDLLTEIANYDTLMKTGYMLEKKKKLSEYTAVLINIKDFKYLNQRIGTTLGDLVLKEYAQYIKHCIGRKEIAARTGNDNFVVLIHKNSEKNFLNKLSDVKVDIGEELVTVNSRCGIYSIGNGVTMDEVMNAAAVALNDSRESSSTDYVRFEEKMYDEMVRRKHLLADYRNALTEREFSVFYQPKVDIKTNTLCGAEALVRWIKDGKVIPPMSFIPVLEEEGSVGTLDFYVFEQVCRDICSWIDEGITPVRISSNFSKLHLSDPNFAEDILAIVNKHGVDPKYLEIELTESSGYDDFDALTKFVNCMNEAHIYTSIDDFGTGYSSLSMLKDINVNVVKIDKSFLGKEGDENQQQGKMLENVIRMINDLNRTVICEGVENETQLNFLKNADCFIVQGYFFDKPLMHDDFESRLKAPVYKPKQ